MKKIIQIIFISIIAFTLVACGEKASTKTQEKNVMQFFAYFKESKIEEVESLMTKQGYTDLETLKASIDQSFSEMLDTDTYGDIAVKEAEKFLKDVFKKAFKNIKTDKVTVEDNKTSIVIKGKRIVLTQLEAVFDSEEVQKNFYEFSNNEENKNKMVEIYTKDGQAGLTKYMMEVVSPKLFGVYRKALDQCEYKTFKQKFVLVKEDGKWLINEIKDN